MDKLAKLLFKNARYSVTDLAAMLDTTEQDVRDRIKKLEADGVINGYRALINWEKLGDKRITAMVELKVTPQPDAGYEAVSYTHLLFGRFKSYSANSDFTIESRIKRMYNLNGIVPYEIARSIAECYCAAVILKCTFCVF